MIPKLWLATKAFLIHNGKVLIVREAATNKDGSGVGKYGFVGGRIEPGQRFDESLLREIKEETGLTATIGKPFYVDEWRPVVRGEQWQIVATFFECFTETDKVVLSDEHDDYQWIEPKDFSNYELYDNSVPIFEAYLDK